MLLNIMKEKEKQEMKKKKLAKILILVLSVALILTGLVLAVSADAGTPGATYSDGDGGTLAADTLEAAFAASPDNDVVTLTGNTTVTATITVDKRTTLDLNGYTLTANVTELFKMADNVFLDIVGTGTINLDGMLLNVPDTFSADFSVTGSGKGIVINHNGSKKNIVTQAKSGVLDFKNVDVVAIPNTDTVFKALPGGTAAYNMIGVTIDTTGSTNVDPNSGVFYISDKGHLNLKNCNIDTNGVVVEIQSQSAGIENFIVIDGCYIRSYNKTKDTAIFGSYATIASDLIVKDSYLESTNRPVMINNSINGAAVVLDNSILHHNGDRGTQIARTCNVVVKNGSKITGSFSNVSLFHDTYNTSKSALEGFSLTPVYYYLYEGSRLNQHVYNRIVNLTKIELKDANGNLLKSHYNEEYVRFVEIDAEGVESYVKPSDSNNLTIIYDPAGDKGAPYVVAPVSESIPTLFTKAEDGTLSLNTLWEASSATDGIAGDVLYYSQNGVHRTQYNETNLSFGNGGINGDVAFRYTLNGKTNSSPVNFIWGLGKNEAIYKQKATCSVDALVYDFDIAAGSPDGFIPGNISLHNRQTAEDSGNEAVSLIHIDGDGIVTSNATPITKALDTYQLNMSGWNHVTIVIETKSETGSAFVFINGTYFARYSAMSQPNSDSATYLYGPRFDGEVKTGHALASNTTREINIDNVLMRSFGTGTFASSPMTEAAAREYLVDGGKAWRNDNPSGGNIGGISVGGVQFDNLNDALVEANKLGIAVSVNGKIDELQSVTASGVVKTNGYAIPLTKDSLGAKVTLDENGNVSSYEFDEKYTETVTVKWFVGNHRYAEQLASDDYYVIETYKMGHLPIYTGEKLGYDYYKEGNVLYVAGQRTGWNSEYGMDTLAEDILPVMADGAKTLVYYPTYSGYYKVTARYVILNSNGLYSRSGSIQNIYGSDWWNASNRIDTYGNNYSIGLQYGETLVLCKSDITFIGSFGAPRANNGEEKVFNIDLNGCTMNIRAEKNNTGKVPNVFQIKLGETMNFYSSVVGGTVNLYGMTTDSATEITGGRLFTLAGSGKSTIADNILDNTTNNTHLNVGTVTRFGETYSGENLTINGDCLVELANGDKTCSVTIEDITFVKTINKYGSIIRNAYFNGSITVKNSNFFIPNGGSFIDGLNWGITDVNGDGKKDKNDVGVPGEIRVAANALIDGCYIFTASNGTNDTLGNISAGDYTFKSILYTNCVTNGRIGGSNTGLAIRIGDNCRVYTPSATKANGVTAAFYNKDMTIADTGLETKTVKYISSFTKASATNITFNTTEFTYAIPTAAGAADASLVLPHFVYNHVSAENTVGVTYTDLATGNVVTDKYAKGGNVVIEATNYEGKALVATHKGTWTIGEAEGSALPTNIQESVTLVPEYDVSANLSGLKANLSLYSDFLVNLYIPADLAQYITSVNGKALTGETVTIGGVSFYRATVAKKANEASTDAIFEIALAEGEYVVAKTVKVNIVDYATGILNGEYDLEIQSLIAYMLHYAYRAEFYFNGSSSAKLENLVFNEASIGSGSLEDYACENAIENTGLDPIFSSASVQLNETPAFVFTPNGKFTGTVTITYGDSVRTYTVLEGSTTKIVVEDMKIYNFAKTLTITAVGTVIGEEGEQTINGSFNLDTYTKYHIENSTNSESATQSESQRAILLIKALYNYVKEAANYKA